MLLSKLRVVFENAAGEMELWSKGASSQVEVQLRERRRAFVRRREALQRIQSAAGELEQRISEVQAQERASATSCAPARCAGRRGLPPRAGRWPTRRAATGLPLMQAAA